MNKVIELLGDKSCYYLDHTCKTIDKSADSHSLSRYNR